MEPLDRHWAAASLLCLTVKYLNDLQPEPQVISGRCAYLGLLSDIGGARASFSPAIVQIQQASDGCHKPHIMRQVSQLRLFKSLIHGNSSQKYPWCR